jgi:glycosyltransferase involved in cell wall biosynthesis
MNKPLLSLVIACYNEGLTFEKSVFRIVSVLKKIRGDWEIIFVEDKSTDETKRTVEKLIGQIKNFHLRQGFGGQAKAIYHSKNQGRGKSIVDGIRVSRGKICGYLDVDCEVSPDYIPLFVREIECGADMAIGRRFYEGGIKSLVRYLASKTYALVVKTLLKISIEDTEAGYKFFKRSKILPILSKVQDKHWFWDTEICARASWAKLKISEIPVLFIRRRDKKSTVKLIPDTWDYIKKIIKFRLQNRNLKKFQ